MAKKNKRTLKKHIQQICGQAAVEILLNLPKDFARKIVVDLAKLQTSSLCNVTFGFDRVKKDFADAHQYKQAKEKYNKTAYDKLNKEFKEQLQSIVNEINAAVSKN